MRGSRQHKTVSSSLLVALVAVGLAACGDKVADTGAGGVTGATAQATGAASAPSADVGASGATPASAEEPARAGVLLVLNGGKFAEGTPEEILIVPGIDVQLDFQATDDRPYNVAITGPAGPSSVRVEANGTNAYLGPALKPGEYMHASYGGQRIKIVASAEPGP